MTRVRIEDPALLAELAEFLEAAHYAPTTQLDLDLRTWRGMHPDAPAVID